MRQQACQCPKVPEPAPLGRVHRERDRGYSTTGRPRSEPWKVLKNRSFRHRLAFGSRRAAGGGGSRGRTVPAPPRPIQDGPRAARRGSAQAAQDSTRRCLGGRAVAPALGSSSLPPGFPFGVGLSVGPPSPISPSLHSPLELLAGCRAQPQFLPPRSSSQFPLAAAAAAQGSISAATALLRLERLCQSLAAPRPSPAAPQGTTRGPPFCSLLS